jgi:hypothetical protein
MRVRAEVVREIPCEPFFVAVTDVELRYLGMEDVHGFSGEVADDAAIEAALMDIEGLQIPGRYLDRTFLVARYLDGPRANALADVRIDLSEMGEG